MTGMVEKVARALCAAADDNWDWSVFYIVDAKDTAETGREMYRAMARAAIEAMRTPSRGMIDAAYAAHDAYEDEPEPKAWCGLSSAFTAMFDHALKEEGQ